MATNKNISPLLVDSVRRYKENFAKDLKSQGLKKLLDV